MVFADAPDLDAAADTAAWGIFFDSGEMCTAASRLLVHRAIADEFVTCVLDRAALCVGQLLRGGGHGGSLQWHQVVRPRP
ncbi:aldehyde dehydrogenase family protein [Kutzneria buriramensis]|uniref:aldehyde dehydrogenase family protein n=1 Tax=Kutzneria buriramensis TaxID=1045776 RepID=UPI0035EAF636